MLYIEDSKELIQKLSTQQYCCLLQAYVKTLWAAECAILGKLNSQRRLGGVEGT